MISVKPEGAQQSTASPKKDLNQLLSRLKRIQSLIIKSEDILRSVYGQDWEEIKGRQPSMQRILINEKPVEIKYLKRFPYYGEYTDSPGQKREIRLGDVAFQDDVALDTLLHELGHRTAEQSKDPEIRPPARTTLLLPSYSDPAVVHKVQGYQAPVSKSGFRLSGDEGSYTFADPSNKKEGGYSTVKSVIELDDLSFDSENFARWIALQRRAASEGIQHPVLSETPEQNIQKIIEFGKTDPNTPWHTKKMIEGIDPQSPRFNKVLYDQVVNWSQQYSDTPQVNVANGRYEVT